MQTYSPSGWLVCSARVRRGLPSWNGASSRLAVATLLLLFSAIPALAQLREARPIRIEAPKAKIEKFPGEVLFMTRLSITVRHRENPNLVRTFIFDEKLAPKMAALIDRDRPFQPGDPIEIHFRAGTDTAVKIKGKPTKLPDRPGLR